MIGGVDTRVARTTVANHVQGLRSRVVYWLDLGNWADSGQFTLGQPLKRPQPVFSDSSSALAIFPELSEESLVAVDGPSC